MQMFLILIIINFDSFNEFKPTLRLNVIYLMLFNVIYKSIIIYETSCYLLLLLLFIEVFEYFLNKRNFRKI